MCITVPILHTVCPHGDRLCFQTINIVIHISTSPTTITTIFSFKNNYIYWLNSQIFRLGGT